jgi:hypothetical protein
MVSCYHEPPFVVHVGLSEKWGGPNSNGLNLIFSIKERPTSQPLEMSCGIPGVQSFLMQESQATIIKQTLQFFPNTMMPPFSLVMPNDSMSTCPDIG